MTMKKKLGVLEIREIPCFQFFSEGGMIERLDFIPVDDMPGFTHRVAYNGYLMKKWLGNGFGVSQRTALDMLDLIREDARKAPKV